VSRRLTEAPGAPGPASPRRPLAFLWPFLRCQWSALVVAAVATLVMTAAELAQPFPLKFVIDRLFDESRSGFSLTESDYTALALVAGLVLGIALADALAGYWMDVSLQRAGERIVHDLRIATYAHLQRLSLAFHERRHTGDLSIRVTGDVQAIGALFSDTLGTLVSSALLLVGMVVVTLVLDPVVALAAFCVTPVLGFVSFRYRRRLRTLAREQRHKEGEIASMATETLSAMRVVKAFGSEDFEHDRLERRSEERREFGIETARLEGRYSATIDVLGAIGTALVIIVGVVQVANGRLSPGDLIVIASYARKAYRPLRSIARQASNVSKTMARAERVADILASDELLTDRPDAYRGERATGDLRLDDVSFGYSSDRPALRGVTLTVPAGHKVAIVGASGAGKSTLAALVARFYDPGAGSVRLDGRDLRDCSLGWLRDQVALVLQDTMLFTGNVTENIAYGLDSSRDRTVAAAKAAGAHAFVSGLPDGYDTELGPRGLSLSGGQRQRIAIARALLRDPPILVLDEPTTGLDAESEAQVMRGLDVLMRGRTTILITHSLALARRADHVVVLDDGRVVQEGPPEELLAGEGAFRRLAAEQGLASRSTRTVGHVDDACLPQLDVLLDPERVAPVLQRSLQADEPPDVRVRYIRYRVASSVCVHYDVAAGGTSSEAVVLARARGGLAKLADRPDNLTLAHRADRRSPAAMPLAYEPDLDVLVQWLPLDLWMPLLAEPPEGLCRALVDAGIHGVEPQDAVRLRYRPRRRAVLRVDGHVLKTYGTSAAFDVAHGALQAAAAVGGITTPRLEGASAEQRVTVQSWLPGEQPARPEDVAPEAGSLLAELHANPPAGLATRGPGEELAEAARASRMVGAVAPWLAGRVEVLLGALELSAPSDLEVVAAHGDFHVGQLLHTPASDGNGDLAVVDVDSLCAAPRALDLATYAAHTVCGDADDADRAEAVLAATGQGYGTSVEGTSWYLATSILRRAGMPFRRFDERWPERVEAMVGAAESAMDRRETS
jgi:ATP-binding cassette, subfamily B, bacterial